MIKFAQAYKFELNAGKESENLSQALIVFIGKVWTEQKAVNIHKGTKDQGSFRFMDITDAITSDHCSRLQTAVRIETRPIANFYFRRPKQCNLFMIETFADFLEVVKDFSPQKFRMSGLYMFVLIDGRIAEIEEIFKILWKLQIVNVNIMLEEDDERIVIVSYSPFNSVKCGETKPRIVNEFVDGKFSSDVSQMISYNYLKNLYGCPVRVATSNNSEPYIFAEKLANGSYNLYGRDINLINALSKALNFKIDYVFVGDEGTLSENGTATGCLKMLLEGRADLIVADFWLKVNRLKFIDYTRPYMSQRIAFVIPPGSELTSFEKFIKPLDVYTWFLLWVWIGVAFLVVYLVGKGSSMLQDFVFGFGIRSPYMNILIAIFGGSQKKVPRRNFARSLLMMFLIFCLIMRTLYTGSLYRFLQSKVYHKEAQSIADMIEKDFKFYTAPSILDLVEGHARIYQRLLMSLVNMSDSFILCLMKYILDMLFYRLYGEKKYQIKYQPTRALKDHF